MSQQHDERRRFHRIATDKPLSISANADAHHGLVLDASLRGILFSLDDDWIPPLGLKVDARVHLDEALCCIDMQGEIAHVEGRRVGLRCTSIDLESASRLRRLVELNLADHELLERELAQLLGD